MGPIAGSAPISRSPMTEGCFSEGPPLGPIRTAPRDPERSEFRLIDSLFAPGRTSGVERIFQTERSTIGKSIFQRIKKGAPQQNMRLHGMILAIAGLTVASLIGVGAAGG